LDFEKKTSLFSTYSNGIMKMGVDVCLLVEAGNKLKYSFIFPTKVKALFFIIENNIYRMRTEIWVIIFLIL
jgi:hypothetical protein